MWKTKMGTSVNGEELVMFAARNYDGDDNVIHLYIYNEHN